MTTDNVKFTEEEHNTIELHMEAISKMTKERGEYLLKVQQLNMDIAKLQRANTRLKQIAEEREKASVVDKKT